MPTQKKGYWVEGQRVPSVTTIISRFKDAGGLIHWAWQLGCDGKDYREVRDAAASAGTIAHQLVDDYIHGRSATPLPPEATPEIMAKAQNAFAVFKEWQSQTNLVVEQTELPLVSVKYRFGGTFDAILVKGKRSMGDWKTSNNVYQDYLLQLAAYALLWEENFPDKPLEGGYHLLRFDKEHADFHHHFWSELEEAKRGFILMRELYDIVASLKKRAS